VKATPLRLAEVVLFELDVHQDARGAFVETWSAERYAAFGVPTSFAQDNVSTSLGGVLRGLHFQHPHDQGKLVTALSGEVFDVVLDVRKSSPTFGAWTSVTLSSSAAGRQLWVPPGFAHGFLVTSERAIVSYKATVPYDPRSEVVVSFADPDLAIPWPTAKPLVSDRDARAPRLAEIAPERLPP
jgi:dTDP-4-dehydrorhamnose 3,5-epimerase